MEITKIKAVFEDERGSIFDLLTDESIHHVGLLKSKKSSTRGKHYHKEQKQYTLVTKGRVKAITKNLLDKNAKIETTELNVMDMILFPPFHYHALEAVEDYECLVFTSKSRKGTGYEEDTFRIQDIDSFTITNEKEN
tara:strand:+ start:1524 stop:1934 length:411 start_codon:yes stop_codon:yes gene_type:complete